MSNVFYTSDLHISHNLVAESRGFITTEIRDTGFAIEPVTVIDTDAHNEALAEHWDTTVRSDDQVYVLGDISINGGQHALDWIEQRPGIKHLITGNHDPVGPHDRRAPKLMKHWMQYFDSIQSSARRKLDGHNFMMSHYPYWPGDRVDPPRGEQYRTPNCGLPLLHGHTHSSEKFEFAYSLHVGWDAWGQLVPQDFVLEWLRDIAARRVG